MTALSAPKYLERRGPIVTDRDFLSRPSREISIDEVKKLELHTALQSALLSSWCEGTGLAAVQIGVAVRFAWYQLNDPASRPGENKKLRPVFLINPEIIEASDLVSFKDEGCLSIPDRWFTTWRYNRIKFLNDVNGVKKPFEVTGFEACVVQHEIDHMNGILCDCRVRKPETVGRNEPCLCGSGKKFKRCCGISA